MSGAYDGIENLGRTRIRNLVVLEEVLPGVSLLAEVPLPPGGGLATAAGRLPDSLLPLGPLTGVGGRNVVLEAGFFFALEVPVREAGAWLPFEVLLEDVALAVDDPLPGGGGGDMPPTRS